MALGMLFCYGVIRSDLTPTDKALVVKEGQNNLFCEKKAVFTSKFELKWISK